MPGRVAICAAAMSFALLSSGAPAQEAVRPKASPAPANATIVEAALRDWFAPVAAEFARNSAELTRAVQALCDAPADSAAAALQSARQQWLTTLTAWERFYAVPAGPLSERRSQRQLDFNPTRPHLIEKAVNSAPQTLRDLELIGTPAKGLPALEWMLWEKPIRPATPECRYAALLAAEVGREALTLSEAYQRAANQAAADRKGALNRLGAAYRDTVDRVLGNETPLSDFVNHWVGGIERLSWLNMALPVRVAMTGKGEAAPQFPRRTSGATAASWAAQWEALRKLAVGNEYSIEAELRARRQNPVADALARKVQQADAMMSELQVDVPALVLEAGNELAALKRLMEETMAPALDVRIGFSDADGD